jgi:hypothetical protein
MSGIRNSLENEIEDIPVILEDKPSTLGQLEPDKKYEVMVSFSPYSERVEKKCRIGNYTKQELIQDLKRRGITNKESLEKKHCTISVYPPILKRN